MNNKPDFLNLRWSKADDQMLKELITRNLDGSSIARALGRTRASIFSRKKILGIQQRISKTPRGKAGPLCYNTHEKKVKPKEPKFVLDLKIPQEIPVKPSKPSKIKNSTKESKVKKVKKVKIESMLSQTAKFAQINRRLSRGDVKKIAKKTGFSSALVSAILSGISPREIIINATYDMVIDRKTTE
jgi:hypothetical protein